MKLYTEEDIEKLMSYYTDEAPGSYIKRDWKKKITSSITGEDVAALLHGIHSHYPDTGHPCSGDVIYHESELLPVLEALGLPAPIWGKSMSIEEWKKLRK